MLQQLDLDVLYFLNHTIASGFLDASMVFITNSRNWVPVYLLVSIWLVWKFRWKGFRTVLAVAVMVGVANTITNVVVKELIERSRPCAVDGFGAQIVNWIRLPDGMRHGFSMPSSHAVNNFAAAMFFYLVFPSRKSAVWLFTIAAIVALTRPYLGLHYPSDTLAGMVFGVLLGYYFAKLYLVIEEKYFAAD
jgi:undecaprenyl-diphosphatase